MNLNNIDSNAARRAQWIKLIGLFLLVIVGIACLIFIVQKNNSAHSKNEKMHLETPFSHVNDTNVVLEKSQKRATIVEKKAVELEQKIIDFNQTQTKMVEDIQHRMEMLEKTLQATQQNKSMMASLDPFAKGEASEFNNRQLIRRDKLNLVLLPSNEEMLHKFPLKNPDNYVPAGTFVQGVIIEGADVSAAVTAQTNPEPMLIRLTANGTLPNRHQSHLKDCVVTLAASGDISSERGKLRTERLSCVLEEGGVIDIPVEGNVAGSDGKNGMRGNPVWRENALLQRAFTAGALSGLSEGIAQTYTTNSISPLGDTQTTNNGKIFQVGLARGTGKAMDKLSDYHIQRAEQYHPVIQLSAGTVVDVVFLKGFFLDGKKHSDNEEEVASQAIKSTPTFFPPNQHVEPGLRINHDET